MAARQIVEGPDFAPLPYGLWDSIQQRDPADPHWRNGVTWQEFCPSTGFTVYDECIAVTGTGGAPPAMPTLKTGGNVTSVNRGATPVTILTEFDCSPVGQAPEADRAAADVALRRIEARELERAFWTGQAGSAGQGGTTPQVVWPALANTGTVMDPLGIMLQPAMTQAVTGTGVDAADGLGQLEQQLATCYGGQGFIHVPPLLLPTLVAWKLVCEDQPGQLYTARGNRVVVGGGYPGTGPSGSAPAAGQCWVYATGQVFGYRSDIQMFHIPETFDRAKNTVKAIAQRTYLIGYECCLIGAQIATGVPVSPTA